jgi:PAS domain S-box-containing protein
MLAVLLAGAITRPLRLLLQGTERIAQDRLEPPIPITTDNEVGTVTRAFNAAMEKLAAQRDHLRASEERYRLLVESVKDYAIILLDRQGQVVSWNASAKRIKGYRAEEIVGQHFSIFYAPEDRAAGKPERMLQEALAHGRREDEGWRYRKDRSPFWADVIITAVYGPAGQLQGFAKITRDLTERRQADLDRQQLNAELTLAYDTTLEGWSRALDLRDKETEGHSQRVTEMTVDLARAMGMSESELVHVRQGALLHDIGKMGIPDSILLKPALLTEEETAIMRRHPVYAYELLSPIAYLRPALDIPYYHHEKWDGTDYPRGLHGEQIPLAARIFAVVDVWDALRSDRPYRLAWAEERVREHIRSLAGTHFDPKVVELFLRGDVAAGWEERIEPHRSQPACAAAEMSALT